MRNSVAYGEERIAFSVRFLPGSRRRIAIHVMPDGSVRVDAPESSDAREVNEVVRRHAPWVWRQVSARRARACHVLPREYVSGETHFYLGRRHLLKVQPAARAQSGVRLWRGRLEVATLQRDADTVRRLLESWYRERASEVFARVLAELAPRMRPSLPLPEWRLRAMRTQWGSCSPKGGLLFNPDLVKAPKPCIEYVVAHELCHLQEHNHSDRFRRLLGTVLPDWELRKAELDDMAEQVLRR